MEKLGAAVKIPRLAVESPPLREEAGRHHSDDLRRTPKRVWVKPGQKVSQPARPPGQKVSEPARPPMKQAQPNGAKKSKPGLAQELKKELLQFCELGRLKEAIQVLQRMDQLGKIVSVECYGHLLECCTTKLALAEAKVVHRHLVKDGFESNSYLGNLVLTTYVKCGSLSDAVRVFNKLPERTVFSWTAMVTAYTKEGRDKEALRMYRRMQEEAVEPNKYTLVRLLKSCGNLAELDQGRRIHAAVQKLGCQADMFVWSSLVRMYAKCGSMSDAQSVFDNLAHRDVATWNAMITGYVQQGESDRALELFALMQKEGVEPDNRTLVSVVKACASQAATEKSTSVAGKYVKSGCLQKAKQIHAVVIKMGFESDAFIGASLVNVYANCGSMVDALRVFDKLPERDVVLWTAMICGYAQEGQGGKALKLFAQMQESGVKPNNRTFVGVLKACGTLAETEQATVLNGQEVRLECLQKTRKIHADVVASGYESNQFVCNTLIDIYATCGSLADARRVFDELGDRDVVSWNVMIAGYVLQEKGEEALKLFDRMEAEGLIPKSRTFVSALQACGILAAREQGMLVDGQFVKVMALNRGQQVVDAVVARGAESDAFVANAMVSMYANCGSMSDAQKVFDSLAKRDVVSWNAMISGYALQEQPGKALQLYRLMAAEGVGADSWTFVSVLKACCSLAAMEQASQADGRTVKQGSLRKVKEIHAQVVRSGCQGHLFVANTLVDAYAKCGNLVEARQVFDGISAPNVVSWTAMIAGCAQQGECEKGMQLYAQMQASGVKPDEATFVSILKACSGSGSLTMCRKVEKDILGSGLGCSEKLTTTLIHAYGKCGSMVDAQRLFDTLAHADVFSWTALIAGYSRHGQCELSLQCFDKIVQAGVKPQGVTFLCVIAACSHAGLVEKGLGYFHSMRQGHQVRASVEHYVCVVDLLGRAGYVDEAELLVSKMPMEPSLPVWLSLLSACQKHNNVAVGRRAFDRAVKMEAKLDAPYLLMANIYAHAELVEEAQKVEDMRRSACAWKKPGMSWIESAETVHTFIVGNSSHPDYERVRGKVKELSDHIRLGRGKRSGNGKGAGVSKDGDKPKKKRASKQKQELVTAAAAAVAAD